MCGIANGQTLIETQVLQEHQQNRQPNKRKRWSTHVWTAPQWIDGKQCHGQEQIGCAGSEVQGQPKNNDKHKTQRFCQASDHALQLENCHKHFTTLEEHRFCLFDEVNSCCMAATAINGKPEHLCLDGCSLIDNAALFRRRDTQQWAFSCYGACHGLTSAHKWANACCCVSPMSFTQICSQKGHTAMGVCQCEGITNESWVRDG